MDEKKENNRITLKVIWSAVMSLVYFLLSYLVAFTQILLPYNLQRQGGENQVDDFLIPRVILSVGFFAYGLFRVYQIVKYRK